MWCGHYCYSFFLEQASKINLSEIVFSCKTLNFLFGSFLVISLSSQLVIWWRLIRMSRHIGHRHVIMSLHIDRHRVERKGKEERGWNAGTKIQEPSISQPLQTHTDHRHQPPTTLTTWCHLSASGHVSSISLRGHKAVLSGHVQTCPDMLSKRHVGNLRRRDPLEGHTNVASTSGWGRDRTFCIWGLFKLFPMPICNPFTFISYWCY
jgi:hypothetical protein